MYNQYLVAVRPNCFKGKLIYDRGVWLYNCNGTIKQFKILLDALESFFNE